MEFFDDAYDDDFYESDDFYGMSANDDFDEFVDEYDELESDDGLEVMESLFEEAIAAPSREEQDSFLGAIAGIASKILPKVMSVGKTLLPKLVSTGKKFIGGLVKKGGGLVRNIMGKARSLKRRGKRLAGQVGSWVKNAARVGSQVVRNTARDLHRKIRQGIPITRNLIERIGNRQVGRGIPVVFPWASHAGINPV